MNPGPKTALRRAWGMLTLSAGMWLLVAHWRNAFLWGAAAGPYWLLMALGWAVFPLAAAAWLWFILAAAKLRRRSSVLTPILLLLSSLALLAAAFPALLSPAWPLDSLQTAGKTYHLVRIGALTDVNYGLYECRTAGLACAQVYRSGDFPASEAPPFHLTYDAAAGLLSVEAPGEGALYTIRTRP